MNCHLNACEYYLRVFLFSIIQCNIRVASGMCAIENILPGKYYYPKGQLACHCLHLECEALKLRQGVSCISSVLES